MSEILPCPFCDCAKVQFQPGSIPGTEILWCSNCGCQTEFQETREQAIKAWNTRAPLSPGKPDKGKAVYRSLLKDAHDYLVSGWQQRTLNSGLHDLLSRIRKALKSDTQPASPSAQEAGWVSAEDIDRLTHELDVALNGEGAAKQASLCDIVAQVKDRHWVLVPREPTEEMELAALNAVGLKDMDDLPTRIYKAMLAAAPGSHEEKS